MGNTAGLSGILLCHGRSEWEGGWVFTFCIWEADSIDAVRNFIERASGSAARHEYFAVDTQNVMGLPEPAAAAH